MKLNILVTSAGSAIAHGIMKSIKKSSLDCDIITTDAQPYASALYRGKAAYLVPFAKDPDYIEKIIEICKKENIHAIMIGMDYELLKLAENKELIEKETNAKVIVSPPEVINISDDKWLTQKFLQENDLPNIPSALPEDADTLIEKENFPLIIKPRIGDGSKNTFIVHNREELYEKIKIFADAEGKEDAAPYEINPVIQKYMGQEDEEFTSTTFVFDNKSYGAISMNREMRFPGHTTKAKILDFPLINDHIMKVAEKLNPLGPCNFQSRVVGGVPYIFEINCRFSGTTATCTLAGFNHVEECLRKIVLDEDPRIQIPKNGTMLRYFNEVFVPNEDIERIKRERHLTNPQSEINDDL
jgi:carbamoyl-phosphate synthase large subunit